MEYNDYTIDITIGESLIEIGTSEISFSMSDSIFQFFPDFNFQINDVAGVLLETLAFTPGEKLNVVYGRTGEEIENNYVSKYFETSEVFTAGVLNGLLNIDNIHEFYSLQSRESFAYEGTPSDVVEELISDYSFTESRIDSSQNQHIWYRPFYTQSEMIEKVLLENVYSNDSNDTPFFSFIDNNNIFHFESFFSLIERSPAEELLLIPGEYEINEKNRILDFKPLSENYIDLQKTLIYQYFERNIDSFELTETEKNIKEVYPGDYLVSQEESVVSNMKYFSRSNSKEYEDNILGQKLFLLRNGLLTNKILVTIPLNTNLVAGKTVDIAASKAFLENENSTSYSGKFLVERSQHTWDGSSQNGVSQLLLSRKNKVLPDSYLIKSRLWN